MPDTSRATIVAAIIGVIGSIAVAVITNWEKFGDRAKPADTVPAPSPAPAPADKQDAPSKGSPVINIAGTWRDSANPANGSRITQNGTTFEFEGWGVLPPGIPFESKGSGMMTGQEFTNSYTTRYQNGWTSSGRCTGTVTPDGSHLTSKCDDSLVGTFVNSGYRQ
jgi:hypothetical protein